MKDLKGLKPIHILPFKLHDISEFKIKEYPIIHPDSAEYERFWIEEAKKCIEGHWGHDYNPETKEGGYRWCPGNLYFYVNMTEMEVDMDDNTKAWITPSLRDVEWYIFYGLAACDGFSGFEKDEEYTCFRSVGKLQNKEKLTVQDEHDLKKYEHILKKPNGEYKKYVNAKEYLYRTFDRPMGKAMYYNEARNLILLSTRRIGKSFSVNGGCILYDFTFNGARNLRDYLDKKTNSTVVVGASDSTYTKELLGKFNHGYNYLKKHVGSYSDGVNSWNGCFWSPTSGSVKRSGGVITNAVPEKSGQGFIGAGSKIVNVSYHNNPNAGVGYGARRMIIEESGLLDNFKDVHGENSATQKGTRKYGYSIYIGTGGNVEKIQAIREAFLSPDSFECVGYEDLYTNSGNKIGMFIPCYYKNNQFRDEQGNLDVELSFQSEMDIREERKKEGSSAYEKHIISFPMHWKEMFMHSSGNIFPTDKLEHRVTELEIGLWEKIAQTGDILYYDRDNTIVKWAPVPKNKSGVIKRWGSENGLAEDKRQGSIVVYEHPVDNRPDPTFKDPLYIVTYDPVRTDTSLTGSTGTSLASVLVFKAWYLEELDTLQYNIVAEWIGRHNKLYQDHEIAFKLACYYDAKILPEINNEDILRYARQTNRMNMIHYKPATNPSELTKAGVSKSRGVLVTKGMKPQLENFSNEVLKTVVSKRERIEGNIESLDQIQMVEELPSLRLAEELLYYNRDGNFDHVSSFFLVGLWARSQDIKPIQREDEDEYDNPAQQFIEFMDNSGGLPYNPAFEY